MLAAESTRPRAAKPSLVVAQPGAAARANGSISSARAMASSNSPRSTSAHASQLRDATYGTAGPHRTSACFADEQSQVRAEGRDGIRERADARGDGAEEEVRLDAQSDVAGALGERERAPACVDRLRVIGHVPGGERPRAEDSCEARRVLRRLRERERVVEARTDALEERDRHHRVELSHPELEGLVDPRRRHRQLLQRLEGATEEGERLVVARATGRLRAGLQRCKTARSHHPASKAWNPAAAWCGSRSRSNTVSSALAWARRRSR